MIIRKFSLVVCAAMMLSMSACGQQDNSSQVNEKTAKPVEYMDLELGKDYTDLNTTLTVLTHRTDLIQDTELDTELPDYARKFNEMYPNITIVYEGVTDYDFDVKNRLNSGYYGDVLNIPGDLDNSEMPKYFEELAPLNTLSETYNFVDKKSYNNIVYGIPSGGNASGIVYNKKIFQDAGITELPKTAEEFLADLKLIKEKTSAIPLYTNYAAEWTLLNWDYDVMGASVEDDNYRNTYMVTANDVFSKHSDNTGPYEVYNILYRVVTEGLTEKDPSKTSWEQSKERMNNGEIATMVLGSWAVSQIQGAGNNADDIDYMPFPLTINGKQHALAGSDYCYGINKNIDDDKKIAAKLYIKFMTEQSRYAYNNSNIPVVKNEMYPEAFANFTDVVLVDDVLNSDEFDAINKKSLNIMTDPSHLMELIDRALVKEDFDAIMNDWNAKWKK